jgi:hypothetical protein
MPLWGSTDQANNAPKFRVTDKFVSGQSATGAANAYNNTAVSTLPGQVGVQVLDVVGADVNEAAALRNHGSKITHPGWVLFKLGTGPVASITPSGGTGYSNTDVVKVSNGTTNAQGTIVTDGSGVPQSVTLGAGGSGFTAAALAVVAVANSTGGASAGTGATFTVKLGGRAGRKQHEVLVAMGTISGDGPDDALLPDS